MHASSAFASSKRGPTPPTRAPSTPADIILVVAALIGDADGCGDGKRGGAQQIAIAILRASYTRRAGSRCATRTHTRANREDNFSPVASRHVIGRQARFGRANASSLADAGLCLSSRRIAHDPTTSLADAALPGAPYGGGLSLALDGPGEVHAQGRRVRHRPRSKDVPGGARQRCTGGRPSAKHFAAAGRRRTTEGALGGRAVAERRRIHPPPAHAS